MYEEEFQRFSSSIYGNKTSNLLNESGNFSTSLIFQYHCFCESESHKEKCNKFHLCLGNRQNDYEEKIKVQCSAKIMEMKNLLAAFVAQTVEFDF